MSKPNVLILGGVGFIGRNLVQFLVEKDLAEYIRVVDKVLPATAFLNAAHQAAFGSNKVEYMQGNLTSNASIAKVFTLDGGRKFNYVFNLAGETKYGQTEAVYNEKVFEVSDKCATEAAKVGVDKFVEVSTAQVYEAKKKASKEDGKTDPWTLIAKYKLNAEKKLREIPNLNLVIVRPSVVYGPGDILGISPRIITGAVYKHLAEKMQFLWTGDLRYNTVHVRDVCKALWHVATTAPKGSLFNLSDKGDTDAEMISKILEKIFQIKTGFLGSIVSNLAQLNLKGVCEEANNKHLKPWSDLCKDKGILNTPLTPYIDQELLYNNHLSVDGTAIEATGFKYDYPEITDALVREQIEYFTSQRLFPAL
ncbi:NAD-dependent epimerase/dehydratase family protein [Heterostelium album PN500]|uniref:NAD-dependent epimerase/dehydratase family protein n=1 Tax=Heterostelium pallidum (strain ATCC 26659 / Pp 5 / PN500) TaxID=670386 RepID=D3BE39_HETP5|nr:NAD-dependent epimerase/dehydratase family protein [Heterostelium album PN500]EFA80170.1 NAD-dependent epimerase/dehydratase family protein [Heterostelium album PN500]|eukprot:XP_020432290.1 NAD-dependent epimerase/dehydratase family protein [Heterostelium album PN500]